MSPGDARALQAAGDQLTVEAIREVSALLRHLYRDVLLGSVVHDTNALRGILGTPQPALFTTLWPDDATYPRSRPCSPTTMARGSS